MLPTWSSSLLHACKQSRWTTNKQKKKISRWPLKMKTTSSVKRFQQDYLHLIRPCNKTHVSSHINKSLMHMMHLNHSVTLMSKHILAPRPSPKVNHAYSFLTKQGHDMWSNVPMLTNFKNVISSLVIGHKRSSLKGFLFFLFVKTVPRTTIGKCNKNDNAMLLIPWFPDLPTYDNCPTIGQHSLPMGH